MGQALRLLPCLAFACLVVASLGASGSAILTDHSLDSSSSSSSSSSRELLQTASTQSRAGCVCPMHFEPVCGADGKTHGNSCVAGCKGAKIEHKGECKPHGSVKADPSAADKPKKAPCVCAKMYAPVCCKDQKTYANACEAKCAGAEIDTTGPCLDSSSSSSITSTTNKPPVSIEAAPCTCDKTLKEVCAEDGKSYNNECMAICAGTKVVSEGACKAKPKPECKAPCWWPYKPVCGEDGKTYANECRAACKGTNIAHQGSCRTRTRNGGLLGRRPACVCTANYDPVCGKNGKTYSNKCEASCEDVTVAYPGICEEPADAQGSSNEGQTPLPITGGCVCPMVWKPVCTTTGKTRGNSCEVKCRGETVAREGECDSTSSIDGAALNSKAQADKTAPKVESLSTESATTPAAENAGVPMKPPRKPSCVCIQLWAPVCGADGNTYSNKCEAKCHDMAVSREGECDSTSAADGAALNSRSASGILPGCNVCPAVFAPVCGKDGKTYGNDCEAACRGKTTVAYEGRCAGDKASEHTGVSGLDRCLEGCAKADRSKPVCGLDRKRYKSACAAHCHKVDIAYPGDCKPECSSCPHQWFPYCANSAQYGPSTFANCCYAKCNNVPIIKSVLHGGVCLDKCGKCDPTLERPLCCKGRTYKNGCYATCNEEDTSQCSLGRCSTTAHIEEGLACLMGPCPLKCAAHKFDAPVCGSDGNTYPSQCSLMCSQHVAIVHQGRCGSCAPNQLPGGFPFCASNDRMGVSPVCGKDGVTYRNSIAAGAAKIEVASTGTCPEKQCSQENEVCFASDSQQSSCCEGYVCTADSSVQLEAQLAQRMGGTPGLCKKALSATLSA